MYFENDCGINEQSNVYMYYIMCIGMYAVLIGKSSMLYVPPNDVPIRLNRT